MYISGEETLPKRESVPLPSPPRHRLFRERREGDPSQRRAECSGSIADSLNLSATSIFCGECLAAPWLPWLQRRTAGETADERTRLLPGATPPWPGCRSPALLDGNGRNAPACPFLRRFSRNTGNAGSPRRDAGRKDAPRRPPQRNRHRRSRPAGLRRFHRHQIRRQEDLRHA